jgi:hypothetical protein
MKLDTFAILSALDARARRGTADDAAADNREAIAVLFQHFGLGPIPDLPIERRVGSTQLLVFVKGDWYEWTPESSYRRGSIGGYPVPAYLKIWHPR